MPTPRKGEYILKVFFCHGCQSCLEIQEDDTIIQHEHMLSCKDITAVAQKAQEKS